MPFTLSHAAAALPLRHLLRGAAVFPALVIGCFLPDIPYFLPDPLYAINAHQLPALVLFGIPCGWAIYALWHAVFLQPAMALLPRRYALLLAAADSSRWYAKPWSTTLSFLAGAVSHVVWDAFTHRRGLVVHVWPALAQPVAHVGRHAVPPYFILQHASTAAGMIWLALHISRRLRTAADQAPAIGELPQLPGRIKPIVVAALASLATGLVWFSFFPGRSSPPKFSVYNFVCHSISCAALAAAAYALAWHTCHRLHRSRDNVFREPDREPADRRRRTP